MKGSRVKPAHSTVDQIFELLMCWCPRIPGTKIQQEAVLAHEHLKYLDEALHCQLHNSKIDPDTYQAAQHINVIVSPCVAAYP